MRIVCAPLHPWMNVIGPPLEVDEPVLLDEEPLDDVLAPPAPLELPDVDPPPMPPEGTPLRVQAKVGFEWDGQTMLHCRPRGAEFLHVNTMLTRARFEARRP